MAETSRLGVYGNMGSTSTVPGTEPGAGGCCAKVTEEIKKMKQNESANVLKVTKILRGEKTWPGKLKLITKENSMTVHKRLTILLLLGHRLSHFVLRIHAPGAGELVHQPVSMVNVPQ